MAHSLFLSIKFYWCTVMPIHSHVLNGLISWAELKCCQRESKCQNPKVVSRPLEKKFADP